MLPRNTYHTLYYHKLPGSTGLAVASSSATFDVSVCPPVAVVSGDYDPLHSGELININAASLATHSEGQRPVVVIATSDRVIQEKRKNKSFLPAPFLPLEERLAILANLKAVMFVVESIDKGQEASATLAALSCIPQLKIGLFVSRTSPNVRNSPEKEICEKLGIDLFFDCDTEKRSSGSDALLRAALIAADESGDHERTRWGHFCTIAKNERCSQKMLSFDPGKGLSLQTHSRRKEVWRCLEGVGKLCLGKLNRDGMQIYKDGMPVFGSSITLYPGKEVHVALGQAHLARNVGTQKLRIHETWVMTEPGNPSDESDIAKYGDPFNKHSDRAQCEEWLELGFSAFFQVT